MPGKRKLPPQEDPVLSDAEEEDFEEEEVEQEEEEDQATPAPTAAEVSFDGRTPPLSPAPTNAAILSPSPSPSPPLPLPLLLLPPSRSTSLPRLSTKTTTTTTTTTTAATTTPTTYYHHHHHHHHRPYRALFTHAPHRPRLFRPLPLAGEYKNKQRVLVFCSRGVTARSRHLLEDLRKLLPHHKKEVKLDTKDDLKVQLTTPHHNTTTPQYHHLHPTT